MLPTSAYRSQHRAKHCCSLLLKLLDGLVTQVPKHLSRTVCGKRRVREKILGLEQKSMERVGMWDGAGVGEQVEDPAT